MSNTKGTYPLKTEQKKKAKPFVLTYIEPYNSTINLLKAIRLKKKKGIVYTKNRKELVRLQRARIIHLIFIKNV